MSNCSLVVVGLVAQPTLGEPLLKAELYAADDLFS
jgi:hypothetical protein